ncbi:2-dehydro-3-deoxyphosphogluconate aldolase [Lacticaseibacillus zeae DSM 20178 = KCTC 3804]|jgi:2-dehydro-3-deoxyphosphogluconate aldolase/(4S)-4-hydroxy-2-oxoglutarate aldolase|uniref:Bifunctional 4-hydroxy-2-oxoglutarate aldolase/2-dehydro-3-deoxy-phosphogluconate aldolase n=2 Tax=Lacticaseibacillus zeae TaxID=57037 RepID=A0A5R8LUR6_LACZE|nr:bifunctional 4-hydroxy-2-oxoglutarate aldolase/2-dehydro-3-deoxy-phosphogluconate aldolase [Lacticaseibacillus zeae]KRK12858.1 2-dehydro-3-deoxyphosphogluconate aldolase [Lacticaseibacillus zeae DSM 20178 = KCTC 3804]OLS04978.1 2-dehydro-3-deoxyphosphogluconate aldolase [Lacticaseibacillus casei]QVI31840.1 bifunctional 4-hydroxy-2-oxoglutarate aldolase/2-dehydro-3-deoxy-phosphogluconate aldolase [Lacticaseibacillus zeae]TLF40863.1 bifunctional 4-hydroxy-2-oxoglutarate aldolase/2-dehydro-3-de
MELSEYPTFTVIMRGYTPEQADAIMQAMAGFENQFGVEVTMNTPHALDIIENGNAEYGDRIHIGAGTVTTLDEAKAAIAEGAKFMLSPIEFTDDIFAYAKAHDVITVPAAMTPTEVHDMFEKGADIVKIFPATTVGSDFFKAIQAPLGKLPLMAVGGVSLANAKDLLTHGTSYLGIGSKMFNAEDLANRNVDGLAASMQAFVDIKYVL